MMADDIHSSSLWDFTVYKLFFVEFHACRSHSGIETASIQQETARSTTKHPVLQVDMFLFCFESGALNEENYTVTSSIKWNLYHFQ